jgi:hypothetical protein
VIVNLGDGKLCGCGSRHVEQLVVFSVVDVIDSSSRHQRSQDSPVMYSVESQNMIYASDKNEATFAIYSHPTRILA